MGLFGLFGSESKSTSTSTTSTKTADQRIGVEGGLGGGSVFGPDSVLASGGISTRTGDFSPLTSTITGNKFRIGMTGAEVKSLLGEQAMLQTQQLASVTDFGQAAFAGLASARAREIQAETGTGVDWKVVAPLLALGLAIAWAARRHK